MDFHGQNHSWLFHISSYMQHFLEFFEFKIMTKRMKNMNNSKLIYPAVSLLQTGEISNNKAGTKRYLGCEKSLNVSCVWYRLSIDIFQTKDFLILTSMCFAIFTYIHIFNMLESVIVSILETYFSHWIKKLR